MPPKKELKGGLDRPSYHIRTRNSGQSENTHSLGTPTLTVRLVAPIATSPSGRVSFDLSPIEEKPNSEPETQDQSEAMDPALTAALADFTASITQERAQQQQQHNQLMAVLRDQLVENTALRQLAANQVEQQLQVQIDGNNRLSSSAVATVPMFEGKPDENGADWIERVNQVAEAEHWDDARRRQVAIRRIASTALQWHVQTGHEMLEWDDWSAALAFNFTLRVPPAEWYRLVEGRVQQVGESGIAYTLAKASIFRMAPHVLTEQQKVSFLINGLNRWEHVAAMLNNAPDSVAAFMDRIREVEDLGVSSRMGIAPPGFSGIPSSQPQNLHYPQQQLQPHQPLGLRYQDNAVPPPQQPDISAALMAFSGTISQLTAKLERLTLQNNRGSQHPTGAPAGFQHRQGPQRCFNCNGVGHLRRFCPQAQGNGLGPRALPPPP